MKSRKHDTVRHDESASNMKIWNDLGWVLIPNKMNTKIHVDVSKNSGTPKSSISIGFSIINRPFWDTPIFGNTYVATLFSSKMNFRSKKSTLDIPGSMKFRTLPCCGTEKFPQKLKLWEWPPTTKNTPTLLFGSSVGITLGLWNNILGQWEAWLGPVLNTTGSLMLFKKKNPKPRPRHTSHDLTSQVYYALAHRHRFPYDQPEWPQGDCRDKKKELLRPNM